MSLDEVSVAAVLRLVGGKLALVVAKFESGDVPRAIELLAIARTLVDGLADDLEDHR